MTNSNTELYKRFLIEPDLNKRIDIANEFNKNYIVKKWNKNVTPPIDKEVFSDMDNYEGIYQIGSFGSIRSVERFFIKNRKGGKDKMAVYAKEKMRKININPNRYLTTSLWLDGIPKYILVHRVVAIQFLPNPNSYNQVLHKDDNPKNSKWDNLYWGTQSQNILDCSNKNRGFRGIKNNNAKLMEIDVPKIRKLISEGVSSRKVAAKFGVSKTAILWIRNNKTWKHIK